MQLCCLLLSCVVFYERDYTLAHTLQVANNLRGKASAAQEAWPPTQRPPRWERKLYLPKWDKNVTRAAQNQNLCQQRQHNFPKSLPSLAGKKGPLVHFTCQPDTCRSTTGSERQQGCDPGSCPGWTPRPPPEGSSMTPPSSTPGPTAGQWPPRSRLSYFTDEETESKRMVRACSRGTTA